VSNYGASYEKHFVRNLKRYSALKTRIRKKVERVAALTRLELTEDETEKLRCGESLPRVKALANTAKENGEAFVVPKALD
jgi:Asp-tRNA(Asn)/Glu-tRNA(Gln) amidotransferase C subunit